MAKYLIHQICDSNASNVRGVNGDSNIQYLDTSNITDNTIATLQQCKLKDAPSRAQRLVKKNTIIYSMVRPNLKHFGFLSNPAEDMVVSTGFLTLDVKKEYEKIIYPQFLYLLLTQPHITEYLHSVAQNSVSSYPSLNPSDVEYLEFDFPEIKYQKVIADLYFNIETKIALNREINRNLEAMVRQLYDYWFVQFDFPDEKGKPYKSSGGKMVWNETLKRTIPSSFKQEKINNIVDFLDSKRVPLSVNQRRVRRGKYPYYGATGIMDHIDDYLFNEELILIAEDGSTSDDEGFPIVQYVWGKYWVNNHAHILRPKQEKAQLFLYYLLKGIPAKKVETGSIQKKISQGNLANCNVVYPPQSLINQYSEIAIPLWNLYMLNNDVLKTLKNRRDMLLPLLINGQVSSVKGEEVNCDLSQ